MAGHSPLSAYARVLLSRRWVAFASPDSFTYLRFHRDILGMGWTRRMDAFALFVQKTGAELFPAS